MDYDSRMGERKGDFDTATVIGVGDERKKTSFEVGGVPVRYCAFEYETSQCQHCAFFLLRNFISTNG